MPSDSKASCGTIEMPNEQRQVEMKSIQTASSTHDYGWFGGGCTRAGLATLGEAVGTMAVSGGGSVTRECMCSALCPLIGSGNATKQRDISYPNGTTAGRDESRFNIRRPTWQQPQARRRIKAQPEIQGFWSTQDRRLMRKLERHHSVSRLTSHQAVAIKLHGI